MAALALILLAFCSFGPGFFAVRRLRWSPMEKLCGAIGLSLVFVYLAAWTIYCSGLQDQRTPFLVCSGIAVILTIVSARDVVALAHSRRVRRSLAGFAFLLVWNFTIVAIIRSYSGGGWYLDWLEHFQRALFFLHRFPANTVIGNVYVLPARPPMMNVLAAFFLSQTSDSYPLFQTVFVVLNALLFLACALILPALGGTRRRTTLPLVALFAFNPMIVQNATYTWTRLLTAFYVVTAIALFLAAIRKGDRLRMVAAFVSLAAAGLVHYSAGPYIVVITVFYLVVILPKRPGKWRELATIAVACAFLLGTWFAWSAKTYGLRATLASNTTVGESANRHGENISKAVQNLVTSTVPVWLSRVRTFQSTPAGELRDTFFLLYQQSLIFGMGLFGGPIAAYLFVRRRGATAGSMESRFWRFFVPACIALGMLVSSAISRYGAAHETLVTLEILGVTFLAAWFGRQRLIAFALVAGCVLDFSLGVFLHAKMQSLENAPGHTVFTAVPSEESGVAPDASAATTVSKAAWLNWRLKHRFELDQNFLAQPHSPRVQMLLETDLADAESAWPNWWPRHEWRIRFIGDEVAERVGPTIPAALLLTLAAALFTLMIRAALRTPRRVAVPMRSRGGTRKRRS